MSDTLHIYGQGAWDDDAFIVGTREALLKLHEAIAVALYTLQPPRLDCETNDGEGYTVHVLAVTPEQADKLIEPYTEECAQYARTGRLKPWEMIGEEKT